MVNLSASADTITCPNVADKLPDIPAQAQAEVDRNLKLLQTQIDEANKRLITSAGEGGPNFVQNAILGPLADKRTATINRIATAIGRVADRPTGLDGLATCKLGNGGSATAPATQDPEASEPPTSPPSDNATTPPATGGNKITCPDVAGKLPDIPAQAQAEVDRNLKLLQTQIDEANKRLITSAGEGGPNFVQNAILGPLADKRTATINRIATAIGRVADRPTGLDGLATCKLGNGGSAATSKPSASASSTAASGPTADDFVDIQSVDPVQQQHRTASSGTFVSRCGTPQEGHANSDNVITAPGVAKGGRQQNDYVGNVSTDAFSTNESLAASDTTCRIRADRSTYFWPVLRVGGADGNAVRPSLVQLQFRGNAMSKVTAAPQFLRLITGDAQAVSGGGPSDTASDAPSDTAGDVPTDLPTDTASHMASDTASAAPSDAPGDAANARPTWSCTGFANRLTDKYPLCPSGSKLMRVFDMPSCWDGQNLDSADHRTHVVFPDENGACPADTQAVPQLRVTLVYDDVSNTQPDGTNVPFMVDSAPSEGNSPNTDHAGAIEVMSKQLMNNVVRCINSGRRC
ncbi:DUF1996 domain-containing protein [Nonomuraea aurantiaca]|uniref:DUF1996 domain-containing protein n=1 Tax=Nonomuraea aurantiaca TaxID=2878562 RepID=UPI001CD9A1FF|nr:DUF1996 domain-containing protein [Nonomuraea aurantiaca]MCA2225325.1 DUF1996 domain-containing protein [Nonomuraea aurantiaca]